MRSVNSLFCLFTLLHFANFVVLLVLLLLLSLCFISPLSFWLRLLNVQIFPFHSISIRLMSMPNYAKMCYLWTISHYWQSNWCLSQDLFKHIDLAFALYQHVELGDWIVRLVSFRREMQWKRSEKTWRSKWCCTANKYGQQRPLFSQLYTISISIDIENQFDESTHADDWIHALYILILSPHNQFIMKRHYFQ